MRRVPDLPSAPFKLERKKPLFDCQIEVVTPMFGGGCETRTVDTDRLVTARSVRGHLRFWWRACRGAQYARASDLYQAESALWGSTTTPSQVDVVVEVTNLGKDWKVSQLDRYNKLQYGLFAFKQDNQQQEATGREGVSFSLTIFGPDTVKSDVEAALWAWLLFGGVGARTRRGCGSLRCKEGYVPSIKDGTAHVAQANPPLPCRFPVLQGAKVIHGPDTKAVLKAWEEANGWMYDFRQKPGIARNKGDGPRPGRSFWPEPDAIRRIAGQSAPSHKPIHPADIYFPRADLGLPIVFHMKTQGDPSDTMQPAGSGKARMASPFILKPLVIAADKATPMALLLNAPHAWEHPDGLILTGTGRELVTSELNNPAKDKIVKPLNGLSARDAFMIYVKGQGKMTEVEL